MRRFNVTGLCVPGKDYMVDISGKLEQIIRLIDCQSYFTINRARQYGKTTTLSMLRKKIAGDYICVRISFEGIDDESFGSPETFCPMFLELIYDSLQFTDTPNDYIESWLIADISNFRELGKHITKMCRDKKVVLMIDEVDKISNNTVFLHFLGMLRDKFLARKDDMDYTFHSVILVGVYDIKNIKLKIIREGKYPPAIEESKIYNSPWNIAVNFNVDMSFCPAEIATMLKEYETDYNTGMDIAAISEEIYRFTSGYPFLTSRICQCLDEELDKDWTKSGVKRAVQKLIKEKNTLFDDIGKNLENSQDLYDLIYDILLLGKKRTYTIINPTVEKAVMYGFIKETEQGISVANKIFESVICDYFISKDEELPNKRIDGVLQYDVVKNGRFDLELALRKFGDHYAEIFSERDHEFLEKQGRLIFLTYLKPLINGQGFSHIESQFTDLRRMDIVVDFGRDQFIIELKIWHGDSLHQDAYEQLLGYMESKKASTGYLLTFDFRKEVNKQRYAKWVDFDNSKRIFDVVL